jgi:hypothetical protein
MNQLQVIRHVKPHTEVVTHLVRTLRAVVVRVALNAHIAVEVGFGSVHTWQANVFSQGTGNHHNSEDRLHG